MVTVIFNLTGVNIRAAIIGKTDKNAVLPKSYGKQQSCDSSWGLACLIFMVALWRLVDRYEILCLSIIFAPGILVCTYFVFNPFDFTNLFRGSSVSYFESGRKCRKWCEPTCRKLWVNVVVVVKLTARTAASLRGEHQLPWIWKS